MPPETGLNPAFTVGTERAVEKGMTYVIKLQSGEFLGRITLKDELKPVPFAFAYCYEKAEAETLATKYDGAKAITLEEARPKRYEAFDRNGKPVRLSVPEDPRD